MTFENHGRRDQDHDDDRHDPQPHEHDHIAQDHPAEPDDPIDDTPAPDDGKSIEDMLELASSQVMGDGDDHADDGDDEAEEAASKPPKSSQQMIAKWIVENRIGDALQPIHAKRPHCLLIEVPEASWSEPIGEVIAEMIGRIGLLRHMSDLVITTDDIPRRDKTDRLKEKCIRIASRGDPLIIVLNQPYQQLPKEVTSLCRSSRRADAARHPGSVCDHRRSQRNDGADRRGRHRLGSLVRADRRRNSSQRYP